MINCILVDEDALCLNVIKQYIGNISGFNLTQWFSNSTAATDYLRKNSSVTDLVLLDLETPDLTDIEDLASDKEFPQVILIGPKENSGANAFNRKTVNHLLKPLEYGRFLKAVEPLFVKPQPVITNFNSIYAKENGVTTRVNFEDILYFETLGDYVKIHTKSKVHLVNSSMRSIEDKLQGCLQFIRIHRTYYININYLESFDSEVAIVLNRSIPIGSKYKPDLQNRLMII